ncbi:MAG: hypothetical protein QG635_2178 [Bacteroidota bacterium]|nr:hypothetical protein [Bacteroidota bacterium]
MKTKLQKKSIVQWCEYCGKIFHTNRKEAKYCSNSCRTKAYRKRHGIPFPDFSKLVTSKSPSEDEYQAMLLYDELNSALLEEKAVENKYKMMLRRYENALDSYEKSPSAWSGDYLERRRREYLEAKSELTDKAGERKKIEEKSARIQTLLEHDKLNKKKLIISAEDLKGLQFNVLQFEGIWRRLLGKPHKNFRLVVIGAAISGKTTFSLKFANYLKDFGKVVYILNQDKITPKFQNKLVQLDISKIDFSPTSNKSEIKYILKNSDYDFIFYNASPKAKLNVNDINEILTLKPESAFIYILQQLERQDDEIAMIQQLCDFTIMINEGRAELIGIAGAPKVVVELGEI